MLNILVVVVVLNLLAFAAGMMVAMVYVIVGSDKCHRFVAATQEYYAQRDMSFIGFVFDYPNQLIMTAKLLLPACLITLVSWVVAFVAGGPLAGVLLILSNIGWSWVTYHKKFQ